MNKKIKIGISILLVIVMIIIGVQISYAKDDQKKKDFFEVNKEEISPEETLEMTFDISSLEYDKFKILLKSSVDSEDIYTESNENISIENSENSIIDIDKEKISLNQIKLYYPIPKEMEIGTKLQFIAQIVVNNEIKEENVVTNTIQDNTVTNELEINNNTQNLENEINSDIYQEEVVVKESSKTITVVQKKVEEKNDKEEDENEKDTEEKTKNIEDNNFNEKQNNTQNERIPNSNSSNQKISFNSSVSSNSLKMGVDNEPQAVYNGSSNNYLSKLEIEGVELNTSFRKENETYFINTEQNNLNVIATPEDSLAKVNITGNNNIQNESKILVSVMAENGDIRYYRIFVNCENENDEEEYQIRKNKSNLNNSSEIMSALSENLELHTTYYLSEVYVEEKQFVKEGENILKYTNGEYLTAPYDCYILELNLPELEGQCLNNHYIQIESKNMLSVSMKVDETRINNINIGKEATIEAIATNQKYTGYITHIGSVGSNGKYEVTIGFENDGNVMLGMTSNVEINS